MSRVLIGVDAGTSNLKAAAFDLDGEQIEIATIENPVETPQSGWQEQNMTTNWKKTATVISEVVEDLGDDHEILGIGITGQGDGCWLIDEEGDPVRDAILWSDGRASEIVDEWVENGKADVIREATGTDIFPGVALPIMQWLVENEPETLDEAETVFYCKDWLKFKLTGERTMDYSDATLPFLDIETREYSEEVQELVDYDGVDDLKALMPALSEDEIATTDFGRYTEHQLFDAMARVTQYRADADLVDTLVRREDTTIDDDITQGGKVYTLIPNIEEIEFEYWDPGEVDLGTEEEMGRGRWVDSWDTSSSQYHGRLPFRVRITVTLPPQGPRGKEETFSTQTEIMTHEMVDL
jgi:hypothetical protein